MGRRRLAAATAGLLLPACAWAGASAAAGPAGAAAADSAASGVVARIVQTGGRPGPGRELPLRIELSWEGRPERHAPGRPELTVPAGAGLVLGGTGSSFDGQRSTWWTEARLTLPERGGPWTLGPASVPLREARNAEDGRPALAHAGAVLVGSKAPFGGLLGQAAGSAVVMAPTLLWLLWRDRSLARESESPRAADAGEGG
jgi:hypothetical protein